MRKFNLILLAVIAGGGIAASLLVQRHAAATFRQNDAALRQQQDQIAGLTAQNQQASSLAVQSEQRGVSHGGVTNVSTELAELRNRAASLQNQADQLSNQLWQSRVAAGTRLLSNLHSNLLEHSQEIWGPWGAGTAENVKFNDARTYAYSLKRYADEHQGAFPQTLDQIVSYLPKSLDSNSPSSALAPVSGSNDFEIVYQGTSTEITNVPRVALIRERQPHLTPDGKWARVYGYANGDVSTVESDDNFQSWDAQHVIPPPAAH